MTPVEGVAAPPVRHHGTQEPVEIVTEDAGCPHRGEPPAFPWPSTDPRFKDYLSLPEDGRLGISCSGGGIRSATFNLGVLQSLRAAGLLRPTELGGARYITAVSGGCYMAVAHTITAALSDPDASFSAELPPWAPGSPEEQRFRNHSTYLASGLAGRTWAALSVLLSLGVNVVPFLLVAFVAATALGGFYGPVAHLTNGLDLQLRWWSWTLALGPFALATLAVWARGMDQWGGSPSQRRQDVLRTAATGLVLSGVGLTAVLVGLPALLVGLRHLDAWATRPGGGWWAVVKPLVDPQHAGGAAMAVTAATTAVGWLLARRGVVTWVLRLAAWLAVPVLLGVPALAWTDQLETASGWGAILLAVAASLVFLVGVMGVLTPNQRWSLHPLYRERLSTVFAVRRRRVASPRGTGVSALLTAEPVPYEQPILFSQAADDLPAGDVPRHMPELVVCAAINVSDDEVPPGRAAGSFTFTAAQSGGPLTGYVDTCRLEQATGLSSLTLPAMMAISGAAVSPSMGAMSRPSLRALFALLNVRLGVWLPNPHRMAEHEARAERRGVTGWLARKWYEPGPLYLFREAMGRNNLDRDYVYVTDGGHWENLGLVELLRRGCTEIVCVDAAGDALNTFRTIGAAVALARSELRVAIDIDLRDLEPDPETGLSRACHVVGTVAYPDGTRGDLIFVKAAMCPSVPWDVQAYRQVHEQFPTHSTLDQFFDDQQFESYRALGAHAGSEAVAALRRIRVARHRIQPTPPQPSRHEPVDLDLTRIEQGAAVDQPLGPRSSSSRPT